MQPKRVLKWFGLVVAGIFSLALLAVAVVYVAIGRDLGRTFDVVATTDLVIPDDPPSLADGQRLAITRGCFGGCHGDTTTGSVFFEAPDGTVLVAPDIAAKVAQYSAAEMVRLLRHGVRPDGTSVLLPMPSEMFTFLSKKDLVSVIAFLRTQKPGNERLPETHFGPVGRLMLFLFKQDMGTILAAELIDHDRPMVEVTPEEPEQFGRYIAMTSCTECHGLDLKGSPDDGVPPLAIVAAYSLDDFSTLMHTGVPVGGRELDLMRRVATARFAHFTDAEVAALHGYLSTLVHAL